MDDSGPEVPGFVRVDENCSYGVSRTKMKSKKCLKSDIRKQMGDLFRVHGFISQKLISNGRFFTAYRTLLFLLHK